MSNLAYVQVMFEVFTLKECISMNSHKHTVLVFIATLKYFWMKYTKSRVRQQSS